MIGSSWTRFEGALRHLPLAVSSPDLAIGLVLNAQFEQDGPLLFEHACALGCEDIVGKRKGSRYRSGRSRAWVESSAAPAVRREEEEDWGKERWR